MSSALVLPAAVRAKLGAKWVLYAALLVAGMLAIVFLGASRQVELAMRLRDLLLIKRREIQVQTIEHKMQHNEEVLTVNAKAREELVSKLNQLDKEQTGAALRVQGMTDAQVADELRRRGY